MGNQFFECTVLESVSLTSPPSPWRVLILLSLAELLAMSVWFSGTAVLPQLARVWNTGLGVAAWLTLAVQLGFVTGALLSAIFNLADVFPAPRLVAISMVAAAAANAGFALTAAGSVPSAIVLRFLTGLFLAGVYPPAMKILAGWFRQGRGLALGILIGALGIGSAIPHGLSALGTVTLDNWKYVVLACSAQAVLAAMIVTIFVHEGPFAAPLARFDIRQVTEILRNRRLALANLGYFGHMWELYSWWAWIAVFLFASDSHSLSPLHTPETIEMVSFLAMAMGGLGCSWAGAYSDQASGDHADARIWQRSKTTIIAMAVSGTCALLTALFFHNWYAVVVIALFWGISISADSAQFSAIVSEVSDPRYVGTALTLQTALGFLLTVISIRVTAYIGAHAGWNWAAASLAVGPALGIMAMLQLRLKS
ncbi:MAG TPA: MFS transporter [Terriglobales bacterium]|nr:MFS transporter [Terriglobales bacterium]